MRPALAVTRATRAKPVAAARITPATQARQATPELRVTAEQAARVAPRAAAMQALTPATRAAAMRALAAWETQALAAEGQPAEAQPAEEARGAQAPVVAR